MLIQGSRSKAFTIDRELQSKKIDNNWLCYSVPTVLSSDVW